MLHLTPYEVQYKHIEYIESPLMLSIFLNKNPTVCYQTKRDAIRRAKIRAIFQLVSFGRARTKARFRINASEEAW